MKEIMKRSLALVMALVICIGLMPATQFTVDAADAEYIYNWGTRGETATSLSENAEAFYTADNTYEALAALRGGTGTSDAPTSDLYTALQVLMEEAHTTVTSYADTRDMYQYTDCQNGGGKISSFYSGAEIGPEWDSGSTWNREHTWPNSKGLAGDDENDIMMLRPTAVSENSSRSNKAYGESSGYYNPNSASNGALDLRGDVARIFLYVYVRWGNVEGNGEYTVWGSTGVIESLDVLLAWMEADPVDTWELGRNDSVQSITGTRNVFVDYPELAFLLFDAAIPGDMITPSGEAAGRCDHNNFDAGVVTDPTCTAEGYTTYTCQTEGCEYSYKTNFVAIVAHSYENEICTVCGALEPSTMYIYYPAGGTYVSATANDSRLATADEPVAWTVEVDGDGYYLFSVNGEYMTSGETGNSLFLSAELTDCGRWAVEECDSGVYLRNVGAAYNGNAQYLEHYNGFTTYGFRENSYYVFQLKEACQHANTEELPAQEADCGNPGLTAGTKCSDCGIVLTAQEEIPATSEHTYENGACSVCGAEDPNTPSGETGYIKITSLDELVSGQYVLIVSTGYALGVVDGTWVTAVQPVVENDMVTDPQGAVWTLIVDDSGVTLMDANGVYIAPKGGNNNGITTGTSYSWSVSCTDGLFQFSGTGSDTVALASNVQSANKFRGYKTTTISGNASSYPSQFTLYKLTEAEPECEHTNTTVVGYVGATCVDNGYTGDTVCSDCGEPISNGEPILATGEHTYENGACSVCGAAEPDFELTILEAIALGTSMAHNTYTAEKYYVTGVITEVYNTQYGNMYITDGEGNILTIYGTYSADGSTRYDAMETKPVAGDTVTIYGIVGQYNGNPQIKNGYIVDHIPAPCDHTNTTVVGAKDATCTENGHTGDEVCDDCGVTVSAGNVIPATVHSFEDDVCTGCDKTRSELTLSIEEAIALGTSMEHNIYTEDKFFVTGVITEVYNTQYGNMYITDGEGNILTIYGTYSADGSTRYDAMDVKPVVGDTVTVYGIIGQYNGKPQIKNGYIVDHIPAPCDHTNTTVVGAKDATCTENGHTGDEVCDDCGVTVETGNTIPAGHDYVDGTCSVCGHVKLVVTDAPVVGTAYKFGMVQANVSASNVYYLTGAMSSYYMGTTTDETAAIDVYLEETDGGYYLYTYLGDTKTYINMVVSGTHVNGKYEETASTVYTFNDEHMTLIAQVNDADYWFGTRNDMSYTTIGPVKVEYAGFYCQLYSEPCKHDNTTVIDALGATCTENGYTGDTVCADCGFVISQGEPILAGHTEEILPGKDATCTETGLTDGVKCSVCHEVLEAQEEIPMVDHELVQHEGKAPTCTENGWEAYETCENCDYTTYVEIAAGHVLVQHEGKAPTCTENGWEAYETCENCDYTTYVEIAGGHKYQTVVTAPTCTEGGFTTYTCSACGDQYVSDPVDALGHDMVHHDAQAPTCCYEGWEEYEACSRCDLNNRVEIEATGHEYETVEYLHEGINTVIDFLDFLMKQLEWLEEMLGAP